MQTKSTKSRISERKKSKKLVVTNAGVKAIRTTSKKTRTCLKCRRTFPSNNIGNRICSTCAERNLKVGKREAERPFGIKYRRTNLE